MFLALFLGLWGSFVPFIARKSSSFSFLDREIYILGHSNKSRFTFSPPATAAGVALVSCSDGAAVDSTRLMGSACTTDPFGFSPMAVVVEQETNLLLLFSGEREDRLSEAGIETTRLLFDGVVRSSEFLITRPTTTMKVMTEEGYAERFYPRQIYKGRNPMKINK